MQDDDAEDDVSLVKRKAAAGQPDSAEDEEGCVLLAQDVLLVLFVCKTELGHCAGEQEGAGGGGQGDTMRMKKVVCFAQNVLFV